MSMSVAGGDKDTSILDSSYIDAERKNCHEKAGEGRLLLTDAWHTDQYAVSTDNESIHSTVRLQCLSSDPW